MYEFYYIKNILVYFQYPRFAYFVPFCVSGFGRKGSASFAHPGNLSADFSNRVQFTIPAALFHTKTGDACTGR